MLPGSKRGPKVKKWTKPAAFAFAEFFAKRSEPLPTAPSIDEAPLTEATGAGLKWLFSSFGNEPVQARAAEGASIRNISLVTRHHRRRPRCHRRRPGAGRGHVPQLLGCR